MAISVKHLRLPLRNVHLLLSTRNTKYMWYQLAVSPNMESQNGTLYGSKTERCHNFEHQTVQTGHGAKSKDPPPRFFVPNGKRLNKNWTRHRLGWVGLSGPQDLRRDNSSRNLGSVRPPPKWDSHFRWGARACVRARVCVRACACVRVCVRARVCVKTVFGPPTNDVRGCTRKQGT